jgi:radical SAM superfamily enzyme YgiQ (UPF0313 family)
MKPVVLIQPPVSFENRTPCLDDHQFGLGLLALAAFLESQGVPVSGIHIPLMVARGATHDATIDRICALDPRVVAIGLNWVHFSRGAIELARRIKTALPNVTVVLGGQHATLFAPEIVARNGDVIDAVIAGEAEIPLLAIYRSVESSGQIDPLIPGVYLPGRGTPPRPRPDVVCDINALPTYSYKSLEPRPDVPEAAALSTVRGPCPFRCSYCIEPVIGRLQGRDRLTFFSLPRIADQISRLMQEGVRRFTIQDAFFIGGDRLICGLAEELARRNLRPAHLNVFAHPDSYGPAGFIALASIAERATVDFGVETGSPEVASRAGRPMSPQRVLAAVRDAVAARVLPYTWWMVGLPGEDEAALLQTKELILATLREGAIPRWVSPLILLPRTAMHDNPKHFGLELEFRTFEHYCRFSDTSLAEATHFPDLITHSNGAGGREGVLRASKELRRFIVENLHVAEAFYRQRSVVDIDLASVKRTISNSFF